MRRSGRPIAVGTVFAWQTREYEVDDITAAINGRFHAALNLANRNGPAILSWSSAFPAASRSIPRPVSVHDCIQTGAPQFTGSVQDVSTKTASQASSHQDSSSSFAQRCRFSIARGSIRGRRTLLSGAGVTDAIAGATNTQAPSQLAAMIRL